MRPLAARSPALFYRRNYSIGATQPELLSRLRLRHFCGAARRRTLERRDLSGYVDIFSGHHFAFGELRSKVRDLQSVAAHLAVDERRHR